MIKMRNQKNKDQIKKKYMTNYNLKTELKS
jgi:hypothetical protein